MHSRESNSGLPFAGLPTEASESLLQCLTRKRGSKQGSVSVLRLLSMAVRRARLCATTWQCLWHTDRATEQQQARAYSHPTARHWQQGSLLSKAAG